MEAAGSSKTLVHFSQTIQSGIHEDHNVNKVLMFIYGAFKNAASISGDVTISLQSSMPDTSHRGTIMNHCSRYYNVEKLAKLERDIAILT
jgi:hypothetical protein